MYIGDSSSLNMASLFEQSGIKKLQFVIFHLSYWDIIKFSNNPKDLSNTATLDDFLAHLERLLIMLPNILKKIDIALLL